MDHKNKIVPVSSDPPGVKSYDDFLQRMHLMFCDTQRRIDEMFASCMNHQKSASKLEKSCQRVNDHRSERETAKGLVLSGVPYSPGENLDLYCSQICQALGYQIPNVPPIEAKRLSRFPISFGTAPLILLRFSCIMDRNRFFNRYLSSMNLSLGHLGYKTTKRIYLNEDLTRTARRIRRTAVSLKSVGSLAAVFVKNGVICIKPTGEEYAQPVYWPDLLNRYKNLSL